jgi:hypothetical protein
MGTTLRIPKSADHAILAALVSQHNADREGRVSTNIHYTATPEGGVGDFENQSATVLSVAAANIVIDVDGIVDEQDTVTSADTYSGTDIIEDDTWEEPDYLVATCTGVGAFTSSSTITITGTYLGSAVTDVLTITGTDGETVYGDQLFDANSVTLVAVEAQADTDGSIALGRAMVPELIVRANRLKGVINEHFEDTLAHATAVSAEVETDAATTLATANTLATALKAAYTTHLTASNVHPNNDATNTIAANDATTIATLIGLLNEMRVDVAAHIASALGGGGHIELI